MVERAAILKGRPPSQFVGGWEAGLLGLMALLYISGALINPAFFGTTDALHALLRDSARYGVMAAGMTFVRCSILVAPKIGEMIPPTCCKARPRPTMVLEPEIACR